MHIATLSLAAGAWRCLLIALEAAPVLTVCISLQRLVFESVPPLHQPQPAPPGSPNACGPPPGCRRCRGQDAAAGREGAGGTAGGGEWTAGWAHAGGGKGRLIFNEPVKG